MATVAQLPSGLVTLDLNGDPIFDLNKTLVLNDLGTVQAVTGDIGATNSPGGDPAVAEYGETLTVPVGGGNTISGTYVGPITLSTANVHAGIPFVADIGVKVNEINGYVIQGSDGKDYIISDQNLAKDHLGVTVTLTVLGQHITVTAPVSELTTAVQNAISGIPFVGPLVGQILDGVTDLAQQAINTAVVNIAPGGGTLDVICFVRGTMIRTNRGDVAIEDLAKGDLVMTLDHGLQPIRWIGRQMIGPAWLSRDTKLCPIRIRAGALGAGMPASDLLVSPQHRILVRSHIAQKMFGADEVLVAAKQLCQLHGIDIATDLPEVEYFHMLFTRHEVVLANGAQAESLFTGPMALASVGVAARDEIFAIFPELRDRDYSPAAARMLVSGRMGRKLAVRHRQNARPLNVLH